MDELHDLRKLLTCEFCLVDEIVNVVTDVAERDAVFETRFGGCVSRFRFLIFARRQLTPNQKRGPFFVPNTTFHFGFSDLGTLLVLAAKEKRLRFLILGSRRCCLLYTSPSPRDS